MNIWAALLWGAFTSASLYIGQALAGPLENRDEITSLVMGFGAGTLLSAVAYELIPESSLTHGLGIGLGFLLGALTYYVADRIIDQSGGANRQDIGGGDPQPGSGAAMLLGALLDGIPESFILGITIASGTGVSVAFVVAFVVAVFVSNIPQGVAGTSALKKAGSSSRHIFGMWTALTIASAISAGIGYTLGNTQHLTGLYAEAFAAGAVLTMLANSMMPEAFENGGALVGLVTVVGYLVAAALTALQ